MSKYYNLSPYTTKGLHKKFDAQLLQIFDISAREKIKNILGDYVMDNPNIKQQDLIINSSTCKYKYLELQVCCQWVQENYPYDNLYIYETKARYGNDTLFLILNKFLTRCYLFDRQSFDNIEPTRLKKYSRLFVYKIPWNRAIKLFVANLDKETIEMY